MSDKKQATSDKPSDSLKPCPFCGGEAEVNLLLGNYGVTCTECMGSVFPARGMTKGEAIQAWNTRKPVDDVLDRLEEAKTKKFVSGITASPYEFGACHAMDTAIEIVKEMLTT